jgi:hypothetical protein
MNLLLVGSEWTTLPYMVKLDDSSIEDALNACATMSADVTRDMYTPYFIVDLDTGESYRVMRARGHLRSDYDGPKYEISKTAFVRVGSETPVEYFDEPEQEEEE